MGIKLTVYITLYVQKKYLTLMIRTRFVQQRIIFQLKQLMFVESQKKQDHRIMVYKIQQYLNQVWERKNNLILCLINNQVLPIHLIFQHLITKLYYHITFIQTKIVLLIYQMNNTNKEKVNLQSNEIIYQIIQFKIYKT